jgi:hypothetical protein
MIQNIIVVSLFIITLITWQSSNIILKISNVNVNFIHFHLDVDDATFEDPLQQYLAQSMVAIETHFEDHTSLRQKVCLLFFIKTLVAL